ncbi:Protein DMP5 [Linum grandiflorum]
MSTTTTSSSSLRSRKPQPNDQPPSTNPDDIPPPPPATTAAATQHQTLSQRAISQTLTTTANLANLLPTGTVLAFQLLTPLFTKNGSCSAASAAAPLTLILLALLAASCFVASFTDSVVVATAGEQNSTSSSSSVYYGLATKTGIFLFDCPAGAVAKEELSKYKVRFVDWVHAVLSVLVFVSVALRDRNVVSCFYPLPGEDTKQILDVVPIGIGVVCSLLFVVFPTRRHGIGYPLTPPSSN